MAASLDEVLVAALRHFLSKEKLMTRSISFALATTALIAGCASVNKKVYEPARIEAIDAWTLDFAYESGAVEQSQKSGGDSEVKVVNTGHPATDLQLRDDIFYLLKDEHAIPLKKIGTEAPGRIQIHPIHFAYGGFKLLTVTLVDKQGETLARLKIENGDRNATYKDEDSFAKYAAKAIARSIKQK